MPSSPSTVPSRRAQARLRTVDDFEQGDYVVDLYDTEATPRTVYRISALSEGGLTFEGLPANTYPAARWDWATESEIDAAIAAGTVSA
jgi:hypothetical protein